MIHLSCHPGHLAWGKMQGKAALAICRLSDQATLHCLHRRFKQNLGPKLLANAVQMIPEGRQGDAQFAGDAARRR